MPPLGVARALAVQSVDRMDPGWPPVLIVGVVALLLAAVTVVAVMFRRLRAAARDERFRPRGWRQ